MRQTRDIALEELTAAGDTLSVAATRVDPAHSIGAAMPNSPSLAELPVDQAINELVRLEGAVQLKSQADQLAAHLTERQRQLESRAAELSAQRAAFDQELREARLWLDEREGQLNQREDRLKIREAELQARLSKSAENGATAAPSSEPGRPLGFQPRAAADAPYRLDPAEKVKPKGIPGPPTENRRQLADRQQALQKTREQLDRRRAALEEFWQESSRTRREALELRLVAEELLTQLKASLNTVQVGESLAAVRQRLAKRYRGDLGQLTEGQHELLWLKNDLEAEQERLERRYDELKGRIEEQRRLQVTGDR
jgi:hypothetical protein